MKRAHLLALVLALQSQWALGSDDGSVTGGSVIGRVETARAHFVRGVELYRSGAYDAALAEFSRAYDSAPNYRILYNLAQIQAQRHDYVASLELFGRYLDDGRAEISEPRAAAVLGEMAELERRIARLQVESNVDAARLFLNDSPATDLPRGEPLLVNAGIYRLRLEKPGYISAFRTETLTGGDELILTVDLVEQQVDDDVGPPARVDTAPLPLAPDRTAFLASLAVTGTLTGAALTFGVLTHDANVELEQQRDDDSAPRGIVDATRERARTYGVLTNAFGVAAAAALGCTAYFYFSAPAQEAAAGPRLRAELGPHGSQVSWAMEF